MQSFRTRRDGDVLRIELTRPARRNALDQELVHGLLAAFRDVGDAHAVVLSGAGDSFCMGADADWFRAAGQRTEDQNVADAAAFADLLTAIEQCPAPVLARVQGDVLGGGVATVAAADIAVAHTAATFAIREVRLGIVPAFAYPFMLEKIGVGAARRYFLTGETFDAPTALRIGLVHDIADDVDAAVERILGELRAGGPQAVRAAKRLVLERPARADVGPWLAARRTSDEGREGITAILENRSPRWG
jgi:methylglutaconyl-CoA hydratase